MGKDIGREKEGENGERIGRQGRWRERGSEGGKREKVREEAIMRRLSSFVLRSASVTGSASIAHKQVSNPGYVVYTIYDGTMVRSRTYTPHMSVWPWGCGQIYSTHPLLEQHSLSSSCPDSSSSVCEPLWWQWWTPD